MKRARRRRGPGAGRDALESQATGLGQGTPRVGSRTDAPHRPRHRASGTGVSVAGATSPPRMAGPTARRTRCVRGWRYVALLSRRRLVAGVDGPDRLARAAARAPQLAGALPACAVREARPLPHAGVSLPRQQPQRAGASLGRRHPHRRPGGVSLRCGGQGLSAADRRAGRRMALSPPVPGLVGAGLRPCPLGDYIAKTLDTLWSYTR